MKRVSLPLLLAALLALGLAAAAPACTVSTDCNNGCSLDKICTSPYPPCELFCSVSSQVLTCSGNVCSGDSTSVTCDGVTQTCTTTSRCTQGTYWIRCGSTTRQCTSNCPL